MVFPSLKFLKSHLDVFLNHLLQVSLLEQRLDQMVSRGPFQPITLSDSVGEFCLRNKIERHVKPFSQPWCFSDPTFLLHWSFLLVYVVCLSCVMDFNREKELFHLRNLSFHPGYLIFPETMCNMLTVTLLASVLLALSLSFFLPSLFVRLTSGALFG